MDLEAYAAALRAVIENPDYDILLDADKYWAKSGEPSNGRAAFKLTPSGQCLKEFISLLELFDHREPLEECGRHLAQKIGEIRGKTSFTTIVTCSPPSKLLAHLFHDKIEAVDSGRELEMVSEDLGGLAEDVRLRHLGTHPVHDCTEELQSFRGETVLILADVIATGTVVRQVARAILDLGGEPVAILAVVLTEPTAIAKVARGEDLLWPAGKGSKNLRVHCLTTREIRPLDQDEIDSDRILEIDPEVGLPEEVPRAQSIDPLFDSKTMFAHAEKSGALACSFFRVDSQNFSIALRIPVFLESCGDALWKKISGFLAGDNILVSTYSRTDILLKDFVERRRLAAGAAPKDCVLLYKKDTQPGSYTYFLSPAPRHGKTIAQQDVVLFLTSVQTAEKLRNIASLLASEKVRSIRVVCLFNRMGIHTADFVSRVQTLLAGIGRRGHEEARTIFEFHAVYNMREISASHIWRMQVMAEKLFSKYMRSTRVESFRRLATNYKKYFQSRPVSSHAFLNERPVPLDHPRTVAFIENLVREDGSPGVTTTDIELTTEEGLLFCLCANLALTRDYAPLISELRRITHKETLFKTFGILLSDIQFIHRKGQFVLLFDVVCERLDQAASERFRLEDEARIRSGWDKELVENIQRCVEQETYFIFALSLFAFLDEEHDAEVYQNLVLKFLNFGKDPGEWSRDYPLNLFIYLGEDLVVWGLSMLLHLAFPSFSDGGTAKNLKDCIKKKIRAAIKFYEDLDPATYVDLWQAVNWDASIGKLKLNKLRVNLNSLLIEIGAYETQTRYSVLRFLHRELLSQPSWHSPISGTLDLVLNKIRNRIFEPLGDPQRYPKSRRISFRGNHEVARVLQPLLEDGMYVSGKLQEIADAARRLFEFTPISREEAGIFTIDAGSTKFEEMIRQLGDILERARVGNAMSAEDLERAENINSKLSKELWDRYSPLQVVLRNYVVDLLDVLVPTMEEVDRQLAATEGFRDSTSEELSGIYSKEIQRLRVMAEQEHWEVLVDRLLLREVLRNLLSNVKHGIRRVVAQREGTIDYSSLVKVSLGEVETVENGHQKARWIRLSVDSPGPYQKKSGETTLAQQAAEIAEYGGGVEREDGGGAFLKIQTSADGLQTTATLQLRSRREVAERLRQFERSGCESEGDEK